MNFDIEIQNKYGLASPLKSIEFNKIIQNIKTKHYWVLIGEVYKVIDTECCDIEYFKEYQTIPTPQLHEVLNNLPIDFKNKLSIDFYFNEVQLETLNGKRMVFIDTNLTDCIIDLFLEIQKNK
jgi:hypothetical protein